MKEFAFVICVVTLIVCGCSKQSGKMTAEQAKNTVTIHSKDENGNDVTMRMLNPKKNGTNGPIKTISIYLKLLVPTQDLVSLTNAVQSLTNEPIFRIDQYDSSPIRVFVHTGTSPHQYHHYPFELTPTGWQYRPLTP